MKSLQPQEKQAKLGSLKLLSSTCNSDNSRTSKEEETEKKRTKPISNNFFIHDIRHTFTCIYPNQVRVPILVFEINVEFRNTKFNIVVTLAEQYDSFEKNKLQAKKLTPTLRHLNGLCALNNTAIKKVMHSEQRWKNV